MIIAIDAGNTRIKWGIHDGGEWIARGALLTADAAKLAEVSADWPARVPVVACNVAGPLAEKAVNAALASRFDTPVWLQSSASACGVRNGYEQPERLGADRWAAMIGARQRISDACLVVCAGTATTVDWLDAQGVFRGGLILPGVDLMRAALARNTAQLPLAEGKYCAEPRNTVDAIVSGCLHAQIGAIERMYAALCAESPPVCLMTGGAAPCLIPHLGIPLMSAENLILEGLVCFGTSQ